MTTTTQKRLSISAVEAGCVDAIDAGGLSRARELGGEGFRQITLAANEKIGWTGGFAVVLTDTGPELVSFSYVNAGTVECRRAMLARSDHRMGAVR